MISELNPKNSPGWRRAVATMREWLPDWNMPGITARGQAKPWAAPERYFPVVRWRRSVNRELLPPDRHKAGRGRRVRLRFTSALETCRVIQQRRHGVAKNTRTREIGVGNCNFLCRISR